MTKPIKGIFPRDEKQVEVDKLLLEFSLGIDEVVNFGTHILKWEVSESTGNVENIPIAMMLRHIIELTDSLSILVRHSSIDPCKPILRSILETIFGLEYILENDTKNRALGFMIWHIHKQLAQYKKLIPGEQSYNQLEKKLQSDKSTTGDIKLPIITDIKNRIQELEQLLATPEFSIVEAEYQNLISNKIKNPAWYQLFNGPRNIEQLATYLNRPGLYEILYRGWSGPTHGTDIINGRLSKSIDGYTEIIQIRYVKDAQTVTQYAFNLALITHHIMVTKRIPIHAVENAQWYMTIRDFYMRLTNEELILPAVTLP